MCTIILVVFAEASSFNDMDGVVAQIDIDAAGRQRSMGAVQRIAGEHDGVTMFNMDCELTRDVAHIGLQTGGPGVI